MLVKAGDFVQGGRTASRLDDGRVVFIDGLFPGEVAEIKIVEEKKGYCFASPVNIIQKSPYRRKSPCIYNCECGGCPWIELSYEAQVSAKETLLRELFFDCDVSFLPSCTCPCEFHYRSRARFQYRIDNGKARLGFYGEKSNKAVDIEKCMTLDEALNQFLKEPPHLNAWELLDMELPCITTNAGVLYDSSIGKITIKGHDLPVSNNVFFQSNLLLLPSLIDYVVSNVQGSNVMDLYSGVGTFSAYLEDKYNVVAVEMNKNCLDLAKRHLKKTSFFTSSVEKWKSNCRSVDTVIVDPPRVGLAKEVPSMLASWCPSQIIYVSCYAPTLHRDVMRLQELGYKAQTIKMFDFYPQTPHMEAVCLLQRRVLQRRNDLHVYQESRQ